MALSADGRLAGFSSDATNLLSGTPLGQASPGDTNAARDVFVRLEPFAPSALSSPKVSGSPVVGQTLLGARGVWAGTPVIAFAYQWRRCDGVGANCANIAGATDTHYVPGADDVSHAIRLRIRARNDAATVWRTSTATKPVAAG